MQSFNQKNLNHNKKFQNKFKQKFRFLRNFLLFKAIFEEIKTKPVLENLINSNIDHRQSPVILFYFKVPPRGLICLSSWKQLYTSKSFLAQKSCKPFYQSFRPLLIFLRPEKLMTHSKTLDVQERCPDLRFQLSFQKMSLV